MELELVIDIGVRPAAINSDDLSGEIRDFSGYEGVNGGGNFLRFRNSPNGESFFDFFEFVTH